MILTEMVTSATLRKIKTNRLSPHPLPLQALMILEHGNSLL